MRSSRSQYIAPHHYHQAPRKLMHKAAVCSFFDRIIYSFVRYSYLRSLITTPHYALTFYDFISCWFLCAIEVECSVFCVFGLLQGASASTIVFKLTSRRHPQNPVESTAIDYSVGYFGYFSSVLLTSNHNYTKHNTKGKKAMIVARAETRIVYMRKLNKCGLKRRDLREYMTDLSSNIHNSQADASTI